MGVEIDHDFTVSTDTDLKNYTEDSQSWQEVSKTASASYDLEIRAAQDYVRGNASQNNVHQLCTVNVTLSDAEYDIEADLNHNTTNGGQMSGLAGRVTDASNFYYVGVRHHGSNPDIYLGKHVAGVNTVLASANEWTVSPGDIAVKFEIRDATKKLFIGGVEKLSSSDNALTSAGEAGIWEGDIVVSTADTTNGAFDWDNFLATTVAAAVFLGHGRLLSAERNRLVIA